MLQFNQLKGGPTDMMFIHDAGLMELDDDKVTDCLVKDGLSPSEARLAIAEPGHGLSLGFLTDNGFQMLEGVVGTYANINSLAVG